MWRSGTGECLGNSINKEREKKEPTYIELKVSSSISLEIDLEPLNLDFSSCNSSISLDHFYWMETSLRPVLSWGVTTV